MEEQSKLLSHLAMYSCDVGPMFSYQTTKVGVTLKETTSY